MSAIEQPAFRSGRTTLVVGGEHVGRLGYEVHAAEHDDLACGRCWASTDETVRVAPGVHHFATSSRW